MTEVHVLTGNPGSGKTTWAQTWWPQLKRFNMDDIRNMMGAYHEFTPEREELVSAVLLSSAEEAIKLGHDIVLDNTHRNPRLPRQYRKRFQQLGVEFFVWDFTDVPIELCIERDAARTSPVGEEVIRRIDASAKGFKLTKEWLQPDGVYYPPEPYIAPFWQPPAVIVDIDGTVALHGDERGHYEYDKVFGDQPSHPVIYAVKSIVASGSQIIFVSGRERRCEEDTIRWLKLFGLYDDNTLLYMRRTGDHRPDYVIKGEIFDDYIRHQWHVRLVLDDRDQVVATWRAMGLKVLQVAEGGF
jgi:predicted kinase